MRLTAGRLRMEALICSINRVWAFNVRTGMWGRGRAHVLGLLANLPDGALRYKVGRRTLKYRDEPRLYNQMLKLVPDELRKAAVNS